MTILGMLLTSGMVACVAFTFGCAWHAWTHRCRLVGVHDIDDAYQRGRVDERTQRDEEIRLLSWMAR